LHEGARESFFTGLDLATANPALRHAREPPGRRRSRHGDPPLSRSRSRNLARIEDHPGPRRDRDLDRQRGQWQKLAHGWSLTRFGAARSRHRSEWRCPRRNDADRNMIEEQIVETEESEELLVEEVSIDDSAASTKRDVVNRRRF